MFFKAKAKPGLVLGLIAALVLGSGAWWSAETAPGPEVEPVQLNHRDDDFEGGPPLGRPDPRPDEVPNPEQCRLEGFKIDIGNTPTGTYGVGDFRTAATAPGSDFAVDIVNVNGAFNWESEFPVYHVWVKGGREGGNLFSYLETHPGGSFGDQGLYPSNGISHLTFYYCPDPVQLALDLVVDAGAGVAEPGEEINLEYEVTNPGNVDLEDVVIDDPALAEAEDWPYQVGDLDAGETDTIEVDLAVPEDSQAGDVLELEPEATGSHQEEEAGAFDEHQVEVVDLGEPVLDLVVMPETGLAEPGEEVALELEVSNPGAETVEDVVVEHPWLEEEDGWPYPVGDLEPGESEEWSEEFQLPADIGQEYLEAEAEAVGTADDTPVEARDQQPLEVELDPELEVVVTGPYGGEPGETVEYEMVVSNPGNVDLEEVVLESPLLEEDVVIGELPAGDSYVEEAVENIIPEDAGEGAWIEPVEVVGEFAGEELEARDEHAVYVPVEPGLEVEKEPETGQAPPGQEVVIEYEVSNPGPVAIENVMVEDPLFEDREGWPLELEPLQPGEREEFAVEYVVPEEEPPTALDTTVEVIGEYGGARLPDQDTGSVEVIVPEDEEPEPVEARLELEVSGPVGVEAGETVTLEYTVSNPGPEPVAEVEVTDPLFAGEEGWPYQVGELAPGEEYTFSETHRVPVGAAGETISAEAAVEGVADEEAVQAEASHELSEIEPAPIPEKDEELPRTGGSAVIWGGIGVLLLAGGWLLRSKR